MVFLMVHLTAGDVLKTGTGNLDEVEALALKALIEADGTYTVSVHNTDGSLKEG